MKGAEGTLDAIVHLVNSQAWVQSMIVVAVPATLHARYLGRVTGPLPDGSLYYYYTFTEIDTQYSQESITTLAMTFYPLERHRLLFRVDQRTKIGAATP